MPLTSTKSSKEVNDAERRRRNFEGRQEKWTG